MSFLVVEVRMAEESSRTTTRLVCISDTHDKYDLTLPDGEILLHAGDFTHNGTEQEIERFFLWLKSLDKYRLKIFIVGNHESKRFYTRKRYKTFAPIIERIKNDKNLRSNDGIVYLQDESFVDPIDGWKFYGRFVSSLKTCRHDFRFVFPFFSSSAVGRRNIVKFEAKLRKFGRKFRPTSIFFSLTIHRSRFSMNRRAK